MEIKMPKGYHHLTESQRCQISALKKRGDSQKSIAIFLRIDKSTISRELNRNSSSRRGYSQIRAHNKAKNRRHKASSKPKKMFSTVISLIKEKLHLQWSPEQISGWMRDGNHPTFISHERIYQYVWADKKAGGDIYKEFRHGGKKYNKRNGVNAGRGCIPGRIDIDERPDVVEKKRRVGDWELDTIVGKNHKGAIVSMVDRATKLTKLAICKSREAAPVTKALTRCLSPVREFVLTLTADNGKEFAKHATVSNKLKADFFFAKPYQSWQRGLNEHTNGLVRQYFPKGTSFDNISNEDIARVENLINNRPRKILNFKTPIEGFKQMTDGIVPVALHT